MKVLVLCLALLVRGGQAASCTLTPPLESSTGEDIGFIMIPGAQCSGDLYYPLAEEIQKQMPGARVWTGVTESFLGDFPNPIEIAGAIEDCVSKAQSGGLSGPVFMAGHSLGGAVLESWIANHADKTSGIILLGSWLPDLFGSHDNEFPVPVLTAIGELDGDGISFAYREWKESSEAEASLNAPGFYPVHVIDDCNHGQVASEPLPEFVVEHDIPSPLTFEEAHRRYAQSISAFITVHASQLFSEEEVSAAKDIMDMVSAFTEEFLQPFMAASIMETDGEEIPSSSWMIEGQKILLAASSEELTNLEVTNLVVPFADLGDAKPGINSTFECQAVVSTFSQPQYESSPIDVGILISASVIKAKFKLQDSVREALCLSPVERKQCMDINIQAFNLAMDLATEEAKTRFLNIGTKIVFDNDSVSPWGPGWEFSFGLHYDPINSTHTRLYSTSLISEPDFLIPSAAGMHYCDLLSPFRALEWIYIKSMQGKSL